MRWQMQMQMQRQSFWKAWISTLKGKWMINRENETVSQFLIVRKLFFFFLDMLEQMVVYTRWVFVEDGPGQRCSLEESVWCTDSMRKEARLPLVMAHYARTISQVKGYHSVTNYLIQTQSIEKTVYGIWSFISGRYAGRICEKDWRLQCACSWSRVSAGVIVLLEASILHRLILLYFILYGPEANL